MKLSEVHSDNEKFRVDAGYFGKLPVQTERRIEALPNLRLGAACSVFRKGIFDIKAISYAETGIPFVRIGNLRDGLIDSKDLAFILPEVHAAENKTALVFGDIVLSKTAYAAASFVNLPQCNVSQDTIAVKLSSYGHTKLKSGYAVAYLNSRYGLALMNRQFQGNIQQHLSLPDGKKILMPLLGKELQRAVDGTIRDANETLGSADQKIEAATLALNTALGLSQWHPPDPLTYTKRASEVFGAGRIDSEHFRPKFAALLEKMRLHGKIVRLGDYLRFCERGRQPNYADEGFPVVNSRHVRDGAVALDSENRFANEDAAQLRLDEEDRTTIKKGDVLMNGTGVGTIGRSAAYLYREKALPDNHITVLRPTVAEELDPVFLAAQLNSMVGQMQVDQYFKGSSGQIELYPTDIKKFRIWLAPKETQNDIRKYIESGHRDREQAQAMLDRAKRSVEIAIEDSEAAALKYLKES